MSIDDNSLLIKQNSEFNKTETPSIDSVEIIGENTNAVRNSSKRLAAGFTIAYIILFFPFFYMGLLSSMTFDNPRMTIPVGLSIMFFIFLFLYQCQLAFISCGQDIFGANIKKLVFSLPCLFLHLLVSP